MLFLRINASYKFHLKKQLSHLNVINDGGPQNGYVFQNIFTIPLSNCYVGFIHYVALFFYNHTGAEKL